MAEATLFERLEGRETRPSVARRRDYGRLAQSILANLAIVFNARQGSCQIRPDYGLPDLDETRSRGDEAAPAIARAIREQIEKFEPRLVQVLVRPDLREEDPLTLRFHISARMKGEDGERLVFETMLTDDGLVRVSR